jgi:hypothetical protein
MIKIDNRPELPDVTLVAITSVAVPATVKALQASIAQASFGHALLLSDREPPRAGVRPFEWRQIDTLRSRADYSRFMLRGLASHVDTSHALCIQWDGFVLNREAWDDGFLDYDYIGAVWPHFADGYNVGNGGFSLRSRRLLEACRELPLNAAELEDVAICRRWRPQLEERGFRFAPEEIAKQFSYEREPPNGSEFGFHGAFNLVRYLSKSDANQLFGSLEPELLARSERREILGWALRHGRMRLALEMLKRLA